MPDKAIIFGINKYESIVNLRGCLQDAENMRNLLTGVMGFEPDNVQVFSDAEVTWDNVRRQFQWLVDGAGEGERLVFHFSGHGSHIPSYDNDETEDELICLWDMNWGDPNSYILDDDLRQLTEMAPEGANLTMVLDCCHSGSGTRAFGLDFNPSLVANNHTLAVIKSDTDQKLAATSRSVLNWSSETFLRDTLQRNPRDVVQARFVQPPLDYQRDRSEHPMNIRRIGLHLRTPQTEAEMNHQLLAAARDDQTAADAYIDGDFNGAFTYYLCKNAKEMSFASFDAVMEKTVKDIRASGFGQEPQNEGPYGNRRIFGGVAEEVGDLDDPGEQPLPFVTSDLSLSDEQRPMTGANPSMEFLNRMLTVSEKFLNLAERAMSFEGRAEPPVRAFRATNETIIYVHGISQHRPNYSDPWYNALRPYLNRVIPKTEVLWSHVVNPRNLRAIAHETAEHELEMAEFKRALLAEIQTRAPDLNQIEPSQRPVGERGLFDGTGLMLDDFARYMFGESTRNQILREFDRIVRPLLQQGNNLQIVSHSWGTVVAYEGLRRMDADQVSGRVRNLFTVGSALSIGAVRSNLFQRVRDGRLPRHVDRIINLDAGGDGVGGPIGDSFTVFREYLNLDPTGCARWPWPFNDRARSVSCAHSSYFKPGNLEVNRDIFARFIN